jgi:predicted NBD/HSP70 family sugar kinase
MSRADLARVTGLSASTVSDIINELRDHDLVVEQGAGASSGGRRPIMLGVNPSRSHIIGIEIGGTHITIVATSLVGDILCSRRVDNPTRKEPSETLARLHRLIQWCFEQPGVDRKGLLGLGVAVPSPVRPDSPGRMSRLVLPEWTGVDLLAELKGKYHRPVFVENDANAGALAELWWSERDDLRDLAYVKVATGIGAGFIIDGKLYRGADGSAGEIGHLSIDPNGAECVCGSRGCLTTIIGTLAIIEQASGRVTLNSGAPVRSIHDIVEATMEGDRAARELIEEVGTSLGIALAGLLNTLNPRVVVLGGEITELGDILFDPLRVALRTQALFSSVARTSIVASRLGTYAIAVGATALVLDAALNDLDLFPPVTAGAA